MCACECVRACVRLYVVASSSRFVLHVYHAETVGTVCTLPSDGNWALDVSLVLGDLSILDVTA